VTLPPDFYARPVEEVAADLVGCVLRHGETAGRIVEAEAYHQREPACHAYGGLTERTRVLFGEPGRAYVYRSYGVHACLNAVSESDGVGTAVLIRALEPTDGLDLMRSRRGVERPEDLCSGPGKLTQALGIWLDLNGTSLERGPIQISAAPAEARRVRLAVGSRVGINRAVELPWRFCDAGSEHVSRPWPPAMKARGRRAA
jgi:DNA-3-methyladenine glycosylase